MSIPGNPEKRLTERRAIFIVEDHPAFREGLVQILNLEKDLRVCGNASSAEEALPAIHRFKPDLVLIDITLPGRSGVKLIRELRAAGNNVKLLVLSMHDEALYADRVLRAGGDGYIMKEADPEEIVQAIRDVLSGQVYVSDAVMSVRAGAVSASRAKLKKPALDGLSDGELEILELLGLGKSNREIAKELRVTGGKVENQCEQIRKKLKLKTANALIRHAVCWVEAKKI